MIPDTDRASPIAARTRNLPNPCLSQVSSTASLAQAQTGGRKLMETVVYDLVERENKDESEIMISHNPIEEERRLFYVAVTRAKKVLELTMSESTPWGDPLSPSRFVLEVHETNPGAIELDPGDFLSM